MIRTLIPPRLASSGGDHGLDHQIGKRLYVAARKKRDNRQFVRP